MASVWTRRTCFLPVLLLVGVATMMDCNSVPGALELEAARYSVGEWPDRYGSHRARLNVERAADVVVARIPWRRRDRDPQRKRIMVIPAGQEDALRNVVPIEVTRECGTIAFEAKDAGEYYVYYLPFTVQGDWGFYSGDYLKPEGTADRAWLGKVGLSPGDIEAGTWRDLPKAGLVDIQARSEFDRFDPMEVVATAGEVKSLLKANEGHYLVFPEDRRFPIRMPDELPVRWIRRGPSLEFSGTAMRNEFYAFQVGVFAARRAVEDVRIEFRDLVSDSGRIPASALNCFNLSGTDWLGRRMMKTVSVPKGRIQALWFAVDIPRDQPAGTYKGSLVIDASNADSCEITLSLEVKPEVIEDRGDSEPWRHSRLRWLDSTLAADYEVVEPYTPLVVKGRRVSCLGRSVEFDETGLPESILCGENELLADAMRVVVETDRAHRVSAEESLGVSQEAPGLVVCNGAGQAGPASVTTEARMESDGRIGFEVKLKADAECRVRDIRLEMPMKREAATYLLGIGRKGGHRPKEWEWRWFSEKPGKWNWHSPAYYDSFWIGDWNAGLHCELRGASYCGPMVNLYWGLGQLDPPETWGNGGKGGCRVVETDADTVLVQAFSGERKLEPGQEITFEFALLITPVKPLDTRKHFGERYYHACCPIDQAKQAGGNIINVHHGYEANPYINYPFLAADKLSDYTRRAHEKGVKVKVYYTVRELTNHVVELWALRSLGHEVLAPGSEKNFAGSGGYTWLREHLVSDYSPAWYLRFPDGDACAAMVNSGASRWYNYHVEGLKWLVENCRIDGLYLDDVSYDRETLKRIRKVMNRSRPGCMIDLHSNTAFSREPAVQYTEFFPYLDRLWFGEGFDYDMPPDYWLVEISGIPFGLMGDMLQNGGNKWRGMVYGMTARAPWCSPTNAVWKVWDDFGIGESRMLGYWHPDCPVKANRDDVKATAYVREGKTLVAVAGWAVKPVAAKLEFDWDALGLDAERASLYAPEIPDYQEEAVFRPGDEIPLPPRRGWLFLLDEKTRDVKPCDTAVDRAAESRRLLWRSDFSGKRLDASWRVHLSSDANSAISVSDGKAVIRSRAHNFAFAERDLPPGVTMVSCRVNSGTDAGMTWGPGLSVRRGECVVGVYLRPPEGRVGVDDGPLQGLYESGIEPNSDYYLRMRFEESEIYMEMSEDGKLWWHLSTVSRSRIPGDPAKVLIGKTAGNGKAEDYAGGDIPNPVGTCKFDQLRVYGAK